MTTVPRGALLCRPLYRAAIPAAALCIFGVAVLLWRDGSEAIVFEVLRILGVEPGAVPFLDLHAVLAAAECHRRGIDVYVSDPCDVFGRLHVYSPLWVVVVPRGLSAAATPWVGVLLDLAFILGLALLMRARTGGELLLFAAAVFSPMTLYALERANNDLVIFLIVLAAGLLHASPRRRWRICSYGLLVGAALLKYYPAVLLVLVARERRRDALLAAAAAAIVLALFALPYHDVIGRALANIPPLSYYTDSFSAKNLPFGLATGLPQVTAPRPVAIALFVLMTALALVWLRRAALLLAGAGLDWTSNEARFAAIGGLLVAGCFFTAQNVDYRGIYFLFTLPGLVWLRGASEDAAARRFLSRLVAGILFLMWGEFIRRTVLAGFGAQLSDHAMMIFWVVRELVWWWLVAGLAAVALCYVDQLPLTRDATAWLGRIVPISRGRLASRDGPRGIRH